MQQLTPIDASFLYLEAPHQPMHIGALAIYDPSTAPGGIVRFKDIIEHAVGSAHLVPYTYRRLVEVPMHLDFPYWINDASFDPEFHIRHISLPKPGDWRQLCIQVARLHSRPLDRNRPLWELYVIEGLDNVEGLPPGCFAFLSKVHHACADGASGVSSSTDANNWNPATDDSAAWEAEPVPSPEALLARAHINSLTKPARYAQFLHDASPTWHRVAEKLLRGDLKAPPVAPHTRFNGKVSAHRVFDGVVFDFERIRALKNAVGGTVNDVVLAICSGALRRYLLALDELPERSLITECPINVRDKDNTAVGNVVLDMHVPLRTDIADPRERALAICQETRDAKALFQAVGAKTMMDATSFMTPGLSMMGARVATEKAARNAGNPVFNVVTTNVPGPQETVYSYGAKLVRSLGTGLIMDGSGLFHSIGSYAGTLNIGITSCREMMPDPARYADCLRESLAELEAVFVPAASKPKRRRAAPAQKSAPRPARGKASAAKSPGKPGANAGAGTSAPTKTRARARTAGGANVAVKAKAPVKTKAPAKTKASTKTKGSTKTKASAATKTPAKTRTSAKTNAPEGTKASTATKTSAKTEAPTKTKASAQTKTRSAAKPAPKATAKASRGTATRRTSRKQKGTAT